MALETFHYGLRDAKIASWTSENSYGTAVDLLGAGDFSVSFNVQADELPGDDIIVDRIAKLIGATATISYGSVNQEVLQLLSGGTLVSNATYEDLLIAEDDNVPFFAIAARVVGSNSGDLHIFLPKCKIAGDFGYEAGQNSYLIPTVEIAAVNEGATNGIGRLRKFAAATALAIPLATS